MNKQKLSLLRGLRHGKLYRRVSFVIWRTRYWWYKNDRRYGFKWRIANAAAAVLMLMSIVLPVLQNLTAGRAYALSSEAKELTGSVDAKLQKLLTYDTAKQQYQFNKDGVKDKSSGLPPEIMRKSVGSPTDRDSITYALDVPVDMSQGVTYHDTNGQVSFGMTPKFKVSAGKQVDGHLVYPMSGGLQAIYTVKGNGLKEDVIVPKVTEDTMAFAYTLKLPKSLEAKAIPDSGGAVGIYSADPMLFGDISFGSEADRIRVEKARENAEKTYLVFGLPAPVIKATDKGSAGDASARFELSNNTLTVIAEHLLSTKGPIAIDPSVVVTSTTDFQSSGNNEGMIDFSTGGQVTRGGLTGGSVDSWANDSGTSFDDVRDGLATAAYNGYLYVVGGYGPTRLNDVQYAPINSNGSIGTWQYTYNSASSSSFVGGFATGRSEHAAVIYNGFLYVIGGKDISGDRLGDVQFAPINTNGTVGAWTSANTGASFTTARSEHTSVAYNGYLYVIGGHNGSAPLSDVQYAPINADGTIGTWMTDSGTSFTTARSEHTSVAYNGYLYVVGGLNSSGNVLNDVQFAPISSDGSVGTWADTNSFTTSRTQHTSVVYNGYLYVIGGWNTSTKYTDVQYAQINANGTVGTWADTNSFTTGRAEHASAVYNGYVYIAGGTNEAGTSYGDVQYAKIDPAGTPQTFDNTSLIGSARAMPCAVAYNGYLYSIGGNTSNDSTGNQTAVYRATISSSGTLGSYTTSGATALPQGRSWMGCTVANGYIYVAGGYTGSSNNDKGVRYIKINSSGTLAASWSSGTSLPFGSVGTSILQSYTNEDGTTYLYAVGGACSSSGCGTTGVYYASVNASTGAVGSWTPTASLGTAARDRFVAINGKYIYAYGGSTADDDSTSIASVEYTSIKSDGSLNAWQPTTSMLTAANIGSATSINGCIYAIGGQSVNYTVIDTVQFACPNANGTISAWHAAPDLPTPTVDASGVSYNGYIYVVAGYVGAATSRVTQYAQVNNGGSGTVESWADANTGTSFTTARRNFSSLAYNGYLYVIGGKVGTDYLDDVQYAPINSDGTVGSWTATTSFTTARARHTATIYNGNMYVLGGVTVGDVDLDDVQYAPINSDGTVGSWTATTSFTTIRESQATAVANGFIYIMGGSSNGTYLDDVQYAPINSDGTVGSWSTTSSFTTGRDSLDGTIYNGYMYVLGGWNGTYLNDVQYAPINFDGTVGSWAATSSFTTARRNLSALVYNGYLYILGGKGGSDYLDDVQYAPINSDGTVGSWSTTSSFTTGRYQFAAAVYNGYAYVLGGFSSTTGLLDDVQHAQINSIARKGRYSKLVDLGTAVSVSGISYNGTLPGGSASISYRAADTDGIFDSEGNEGDIAELSTCTTNLSARYLWISITMDDSHTGVFADANSTAAAVSDFTVNYLRGHPAPDIRLHLGKTLLEGEGQSPLDTCIDDEAEPPQTATIGKDTAGSLTDAGQAGHVVCSQYQSPSFAGSISSISVNVNSINPNGIQRSFQVAVYSANGTSGAPGTLVASSGTGTLTGPGWNSVAISADLSASTTYWLCWQNNSSNVNYNNLTRDSSFANATLYSNASSGTTSFGTWNSNPTTAGGQGTDPSSYAIYATVTSGPSAPAIASIGASANPDEVAVPSGVTAGSLVVVSAGAEWQSSTAPTPSSVTVSGFTYAGMATQQTGGWYQGTYLFYKYATGNDSGLYNITYNSVGGHAADESSAYAVRITGGPSSGNPFVDSFHSAGGTSGSATVASFTPQADNSLLLAGVWAADGGIAGFPTGWTIVTGNTDDNNGLFAQNVGLLPQTTAAATGSLTFTASASIVVLIGTIRSGS